MRKNVLELECRGKGEVRENLDTGTETRVREARLCANVPPRVLSVEASVSTRSPPPVPWRWFRAVERESPL